MAPRAKGVRNTTLMAWFSLFVAFGLLVGDALGVFALSNEKFSAILAFVYFTIIGQASKKILTRVLAAWRRS